MLSVKTLNIEDRNQLVIYSFNYPFIESDEYDEKIIDYINEVIYQDVISFKDVVEQELSSIISKKNYLAYINTEYNVNFNENGIISITLEFSQLAGLYNITYLNSYNYDLNIGKQIMLSDIFKKEVNYVSILDKCIKSELKNIECVTDELCDEYISLYINSLIKSYDKNFYIEKDGIVIYFSSYELDQSICELISLKIPFNILIEYLSEYIMKKVCI